MTDTTRLRLAILIAALSLALYVLWKPVVTSFMPATPQPTGNPFTDEAQRQAWATIHYNVKTLASLGALVLIVGGAAVGFILVPRR